MSENKEFTEEEIVAFKNQRNAIGKFQKKLSKIVKNPNALVQESIDTTIKYWATENIRNNWISNLASNYTAQFYSENCRYQKELEVARKNGTITSDQLRDHVNQFTCNSAKDISDFDKLMQMYMQVSQKAHENKVNVKLNKDSEEIHAKIMALIVKES